MDNKIKLGRFILIFATYIPIYNKWVSEIIRVSNRNPGELIAYQQVYCNTEYQLTKAYPKGFSLGIWDSIKSKFLPNDWASNN